AFLLDLAFKRRSLWGQGTVLVRGDAFCGIGAVEQVEQRRENSKDEKAGLGPARTTGEPCGTMEVNEEQMTWERFACVAGVRFGEDNHVGVVGRGVESDREP